MIKTNQNGFITMIVVGLVLVLAMAALLVWRIKSTQKPGDISSYEECVEAGYPVMESYPPQCAVPGGKTFMQQTED